MSLTHLLYCAEPGFSGGRMLQRSRRASATAVPREMLPGSLLEDYTNLGLCSRREIHLL